MSNVSKWYDLAEQVAGGPAPSAVDLTAASAARAAFEKDRAAYFADPGRAEQEILAARALALPADDPRRLAFMASSNGGNLTPDAVVAMSSLAAGLPGTSEAVKQLRAADAAVQASRTEAKQKVDAQIAARKDDMWDWGPAAALKAAVRTGFTALEAPYQVAMNAFRAYGGAVNGQDQGGPLDVLYAVFAGTDLGATVADGTFHGWGNIDTGDGWVGVDPNSRAGSIAEDMQGDLWTLRSGEIATFGRASAELAGLDKSSTAYSVMSGVLDAGTRLVDPSMYLGPGEVKGGALALRAYLKGGAEAAATVRAVRDGTAVGKGLSAAAKAAEETKTISGEVAAKAAAHDALAEERAALADAAQTRRAETVRAQARHDRMAAAGSSVSRSRDAAVKRAAARRLSAERVVTDARNTHAQTITNLEDEARRLDEFQAQLDLAAKGQGDTSLGTLKERIRRAPGASKEAGKTVPAQAAKGANDAALYAHASAVAAARKADVAARLTAARDALTTFDKAVAAGDRSEATLGAARAARHAQHTAAEQDALNVVAQQDALLADAESAYLRLKGEAKALDGQVAAKDADVQAVLDELQTRAADLHGSLQHGSVQDIKEYLKTRSGIIHGLDGSTRVDVENALNSLLRGRLAPVTRAMAAIDDEVVLADLVRGRIADPSMLRALARAATEEEVTFVLASALAQGTLRSGKFTALRMFQRFAGPGLPMSKANAAAAKAFNLPQRAVRWSVATTERRMPHTYDIHIEDGEQMVRATMDFIAFATRTWKDSAAAENLYRTHVKAMIDATDGVARKEAAFRLLDDMNAHVLQVHKVDPKSELGKAISEEFRASRAAANDMVEYNIGARSITGPNGKLALPDGTVISEADARSLITLSAALNDRFFFPDARVLARLGKSARALADAGSPKEVIASIYRTVFDKYWRTAVLLRISYAIRNVAEVQTRMALSGHPSMWTNPFAIAAHTLEGKGGEKFLATFKTADLDVLGRTFADAQEADRELNNLIGEWSRWMDDNAGALLDVGTPGMVRQYERAGFQTVHKGETGFWNGVANEVTMMNRSPLTRAVLTIKEGRNVDQVLVAAQKALGPTATLEDAVVWMAMHGPEGNVYRRAWEGLKSADRSGEGAFAKVIDTPDGLREMLFGTSPLSYAKRWDDYLQGDARVTDYVLDELLTVRPDVVKGGQKVAAAVKQENESLAQVFTRSFAGKRGANYPVRVSAVPEFRAVKETGTPAGRWLQSFTDGFFERAGSFERASSVQPEQRFAYWDAIANTVTGADKATAALVVANARKALGGAKGFTSAWGARTLRKIEAAAKQADGALTLQELDRYGVKAAAKHTEDLVYTAMKQNQFAHAIRLVAPFAQAWANSVKVYSQRVSRNTQYVYRAATAYNWATSKESNVVYKLGSQLPFDPFGMSLYDPNQGLIFDDAAGTKMVINPLGGAINAAMSVANGGEQAPIRWDMSLPSANMVFQGGVGPGFSPLLQAGVSAVAGTEQYNNLPSALKVFDVPLFSEQLSAFHDASSDGGVMWDFLASMTPGPVKAGAAFLGLEFEGEATKYANTAAAILMQEHPEAYTKDGVVTEQGAAQLQKDAAHWAGALALTRSIARFSSLGSMTATAFVKDKSGAALSMTAWGDVWNQALVDHEYDVAQATSDFIGKYGTAPLMAVVKTVDGGGGFPGDNAWNWIQRHQSTALSPQEASYLFPGGDYSFEYARQIREGGTTRRLTTAERAKLVDGLIYSAANGNLTAMYNAGQISAADYQTRKTALGNEFGNMVEKTVTPNRLDAQVEGLRDALDRPGVNESPIAEPLRYYLGERDKAVAAANAAGLSGTLSNKDMYQWADYLSRTLDWLTSKYPDFTYVSDRLFKKEFDANG